MALSDIIQKIIDEANKKAAFMKQVSDDEIKRIQVEFQTKAEVRKQEIATSVDQKCSSALDKAKILAKMENNSLLLKEKREVIDAVYSDAKKELIGMGASDYLKLLTNMVKHASESMPKGSLVVPNGQKKQVEEAISKVGADYHIKEETGSFKGGFIVHDSKTEINFSFTYLIDNIIRPSTELEVANILFN